MNIILYYYYGQRSDLYHYYFDHHLIRCALQLRGRRNWQITTAAATPNDVAHTTTAICYILLYYECVCVCVCVLQHLPRTNYFYLTSVLYIFFFLLRDLLCPLSFHRLVKFSMSDKDMYYYYYYYYYVYRSYRPARIRTLFFISIIDSPLQHDGSAPVILFFFFFSNGRMMSIIMHFFSLRAQITLLYDPPSSFV